MVGKPVLPEAGARTYGGAFLGEPFATFDQRDRLIQRVCSRLRVGARLALWWKIAPECKPATIAELMRINGFNCLEDAEPQPGMAFQVFELSGQRIGLYQPWRKPAKACLVMRFGAFGDHLMAASVLPHLKAEGWHITYCGTQAGLTVLRHDPHVDAFLLHNGELVREESGLIPYMLAWESRFDRTVILNASVERAMLYRPDQSEYWRDPETRRRLCDGNYLEHVHKVAGVPYEPRQRFWPSVTEADAAATYAAENGPLVMLCLAGSAEHKLWPWAAQFVTRLLAQERFVNVALAGGEKDYALARDLIASVREFLGAEADRIIDLTSCDIRETMALARECRLVVGPETGILNAVAFDPKVAKIVMLSHSSETNLTRDWPNTDALSSNVPCHPCHRLHSTTDFCPRGAKTKRAACAEAVTPDAVLKCALEALSRASH